jgi:23S rRNA (pseudouridine1915-N3)-methyltransferase
VRLRLRIACVGRADTGPFAAPVEAYLARLAPLSAVELVSVKGSRARDAQRRRAEDAAALRLGAVGHRIALDERGRRFTTVALADHLARLAGAGEGRFTLWVGGADGLDPALVAEADDAWRLSDLTLAHELALVVLLEQLYRVATLWTGHPYHRA